MSNNLKITSPLVSVAWLQENISAKNLLIFDATIPKVGTKEEALVKEQIPNAIFFDIKNDFSNLNSRYPNTLLHPDEFEFRAQNIGVNNDSCIIVYDDLGIYSSPRVWWMFTTFGFENIAVLDGGLPAWKNAGLYTEQPQNKKNRKGNFVARYQPQKIRFTEDVLTSVSSSTTCIADARSEMRFFSIVPEPRKEVRSGCIPNSINIPYTNLQQGIQMKSVEELKNIFNTINPNKEEFIFSCGSGVTACILALAAELASITNYAVYDGSWSEWGSREDLPIENLKKSKWSTTEFEVYILLFCAQSNHVETQQERDYIISKVDEKLFNKIHTEIVHDTIVESEQKIREYVLENYFSEKEKSALKADIKSVFFADGSIDEYEKQVFRFLNKLLE